jgi:hypothetical protein
MIDLTHKKMLLFLALLAFGNFRNSADDTHSQSLMPGPLKISTPQNLRPAEPRCVHAGAGTRSRSGSG